MLHPKRQRRIIGGRPFENADVSNLYQVAAVMHNKLREIARSNPQHQHSIEFILRNADEVMEPWALKPKERP